MGSNRIPIDSSMTVKKAITQGGYYNTDGDWNNVMTLEEYPGKIFRGRVEVLIFNENKVFMYINENMNYRLPGGGFEKGVLNKDQVFNEAKEEAKIIIKDIKFTGVTYTDFFNNDKKFNENEIPYDGKFTEVYVARYKEDYEGYIKKSLSDMQMTNKGKFYDINGIKDILREPHKQALENIFNGVVTESATEYEAAQICQSILHNSRYDKCIYPVDVEYNDEGFIFAGYTSDNVNDKNLIKNFINDGTECIQRECDWQLYIEEPTVYNHGFLSIKKLNTESAYIIDESYMDQNALDFFNEAAGSGKYPVMIVNSNIGTAFGKVITVYTQSKYAHSSLSLDTSLENLYSFNKYGFVKESLTEFRDFNENAPIQVKCLFVNKADLNKIKERLDYLWANKSKTKYSISNIVNIMFHHAAETNDPLSMVCSQFVTWILSIADIKLLDKSVNLITPKDLSITDIPKTYLLYEGKVKDYNKSKLDRIFNKIKAKAELYKDN